MKIVKVTNLPNGPELVGPDFKKFGSIELLGALGTDYEQFGIETTLYVEGDNQ